MKKRDAKINIDNSKIIVTSLNTQTIIIGRRYNNHLSTIQIHHDV